MAKGRGPDRRGDAFARDGCVVHRPPARHRRQSDSFAWCHLTTHGAPTVAAAGESVVRTSDRLALDLVATGWTVSAKAVGTARLAAASVAPSCRAMPPGATPIFLESPRIGAKPDVHTSNADRPCQHKRIARSAGSQLVPYMSGLAIVLVCCGVVLVAMVLGRNENDLD